MRDQITVDLDCPPQKIFEADGASQPNYFRFRLSPDVVIAVGARAKAPGEMMAGEDVELNVLHQGAEEMDAYERLVGDAIKGDLSLFSREDSAEAFLFAENFRLGRSPLKSLPVRAKIMRGSPILSIAIAAIGRC
jgi:glucose-6-phosphate 1-dehydrogenase